MKDNAELLAVKGGQGRGPVKGKLPAMQVADDGKVGKGNLPADDIETGTYCHLPVRGKVKVEF